MSPWDLYGQIRHYLDGGRLTMEQQGRDILRFEWWPTPATTITYMLDLREFQAARWELGRSIAGELRLRWESNR